MTLLQLQDLTYRYKNTAEAVLYKINYDFEDLLSFIVLSENQGWEVNTLISISGTIAQSKVLSIRRQDIREQGYSYRNCTISHSFPKL